MKKLIVFYSYSGNTRKIAESIRAITGADVAKIETVAPYSDDYDDVVEQGKREIDKKFCPEIRPLGVDVSAYDEIILGTPVWWYTYAPAVRTFFSQNDLTGKTVYPFATNGGWVGHTFRDVAEACPGAKVENGLNVHFEGSRCVTSAAEIENWAKKIK